jgi:hypothetical protein
VRSPGASVIVRSEGLYPTVSEGVNKKVAQQRKEEAAEMKRLVLALVILAFATPLFAADAYVGLFTDANHGVCDLYLVGGFMPFDLWIWWIAPTVGVQAAEYRIVAPSYVILSTVTTNPDISVTLGDIVNGISVAF